MERLEIKDFKTAQSGRLNPAAFSQSTSHCAILTEKRGFIQSLSAFNVICQPVMMTVEKTVVQLHVKSGINIVRYF